MNAKQESAADILKEMNRLCDEFPGGSAREVSEDYKVDLTEELRPIISAMDVFIEEMNRIDANPGLILPIISFAACNVIRCHWKTDEEKSRVVDAFNESVSELMDALEGPISDPENQPT